MDTEFCGVNAPESRAGEINVGDWVRHVKGFWEGEAVQVVRLSDERVWAQPDGRQHPTSTRLQNVILCKKGFDADAAQPVEFWTPKTPKEPADVVVEPAHYTRWVIEPITYIMRNGMEFWRGNIVKYASRAGFKLYDGKDAVESEITDLKKVIRYAEMRINQLRGEITL